MHYHFSNSRLVCVTRPHTGVDRVGGIERVVGIGFQPGLDPAKVNKATFYYFLFVYF